MYFVFGLGVKMYITKFSNHKGLFKMVNYSIVEKILFPSIHLDERKLEDKLDAKTVLITGASSGIGRELAFVLKNINVHLVLVARREKELLLIKEDIESYKAKVSIISADMREDKDLERLLRFLHQLPNGLDIIVSNAGLSINRSIDKSLNRYHDFTRTMAINYFAPVQLLLSTIPLIEKNKGHIVNVSTVNALLLPIPFWAAYQASKSAFDTWFRSVSPEINGKGILTTTVYLPLVRTPMIEPTLAYRNTPAMSPLHVAKIIANSLYTKRKTFQPWWLIFGQIGSLVGRRGWDYVLPKLLQKRGLNK